MRGVLTWLLSRLLWTAIGAVGTASLIAFAFSALVAAPIQVIAVLWLFITAAIAGIVVLLGRLRSRSSPQLQWRVGIGPSDVLWDEQRQEARHRVELVATPLAAGYVIGRAELTGDGRVVDRGTRSASVWSCRSR